MTISNNLIQMDQHAISGTCMAYIRKAEHRFFPASFRLSLLKSGKASIKGDLAPGRSSRASVILVNPGAAVSKVRDALDVMLKHLEANKPGAVNGIATTTSGKQLLFITPRLDVSSTETLEIGSKEQLEKSSAEFPHMLVYVPATLRHWNDAYDDIEAFKRVLQREGLPRGFLSTALGKLPVIESRSGIRADVERRNVWIPPGEGYFSYDGFDEEEEEEEDDEG